LLGFFYGLNFDFFFSTSQEIGWENMTCLVSSGKLNLNSVIINQCCMCCSCSVPVQCRLALTSSSVNSGATRWLLLLLLLVVMVPAMVVSALICTYLRVTHLSAVRRHLECRQQTSTALHLASACSRLMCHTSFLRHFSQARIPPASRCQVTVK